MPRRRSSPAGWVALAAIPLALVATPCTALSPSAGLPLLRRGPSSHNFYLHNLAVTALAAAAVGAPRLAAAQAPAGGGGTGSNSSSVACGWASECPESQPCCSEYGYCSAGTSCLGGCNPQGSYGQGYCAPLPVCASANYTFADDSRIQTNHSAWDGDTSKYDWTLDKLDSSNPALVQNNALVLTLTENGGGTRVSTTRNVLYGTIQASIKTVGAPGVVTAFITMSGVKDEIDFEWTANDTNEVQSNWYWEGDVDDYTHGGSHTARNRATQFITYGLDWTPTQLDWLVNGKSVRMLKKSDDKNGRYPQTPSRVQFSVWPAGINGTAEGTITWAGGMIDWTSPAYTANNAFQAEVAWVSIDCYDNSDLPFNSSSSSSNSSSSGSSSRLARRGDFELERVEELWKRQSNTVNSYIWGTNDTNGQIGVAGSDRTTIINSPYSTGQNMLVKNGDTKGVTTGKSSGTGTSIFGNNAFGNWWQSQGTPARVGLIVGACAAGLFLLVALCMIWARCRRRGRRGGAGPSSEKVNEQALLGAAPPGAAAARNARRVKGPGPGGPLDDADTDVIPLVGPNSRGTNRPPPPGLYSPRDLPGQFGGGGGGRGGPGAGPEPYGTRGSGPYHQDSYHYPYRGDDAASVASSASLYKGSFRSPSPYDGSPRTATPPVPSLPAQYQGYGGHGAPPPPQYPPAYGSPHPPPSWNGRR